MRTVNQIVAEYALRCVKEVTEDESTAKKYKSYVKSFPALVISEGLLLALAFNFSKSGFAEKGEENAEKRARKYLFKHVSGWLREKGVISRAGESKEEAEEVLRQLSELDVRAYRLATSEALKVSDWLRRIAEGMIKGESGDEG